MTIQKIWKAILRDKLVNKNCSKNPEKVLSNLITHDIRTYGEKSTFVRQYRGFYTLRSNIETNVTISTDSLSIHSEYIQLSSGWREYNETLFGKSRVEKSNRLCILQGTIINEEKFEGPVHCATLPENTWPPVQLCFPLATITITGEVYGLPQENGIFSFSGIVFVCK